MQPDLLQQIFTRTTEAMLLVDPVRDSFVASNPAAQQLLGFEGDELAHLSPSTLFRTELGKLVTLTQAAYDKGHSWSNEISASNHEGGVIQLDITVSMLNTSGVLLFNIRDLAQLERLHTMVEANRLHRDGLIGWKVIESVFRELEHENKLILQAAGDGIYGVDRNGNTTFCNPAAERMLGWKAEELVGRNIHSMIHHTHADGTIYPAHECHIYAAFNDSEVHTVEDEVFWHKDGTPIIVEYTSTPISEQGLVAGAVVIFRDISERKLAETKLRAALSEVQSLKKRLEMENAYLLEEYRVEHNYKEIIGRSHAIHTVIQQIELVSPTDANVLISGESGTGKELIARAIHGSSKRHDRPLIRVNCASIPKDLFESEFFGHVKGSFTGAVKDRAGRFELADGGTIFLDEVGEIPLALQSKLLRVLQEGQYERVGDEKTKTVDVRLIAATNRNLQEEVEAGNFREDLYFRLNVFPVNVVPLRERLDDIPLLAQHFVKLLSKKLNLSEPGLTNASVKQLQTYSWKGNIRELQNVIERAIILSQGGTLQFNLPGNDVAPV
ncbi:MAG: sigma 54-interacting transcriptional regulator, partial [Gammaproteobacteria bacterium]|nr:sigma 54-interacting transcriptional regulator [Gammaproteobacteria bacterium]